MKNSNKFKKELDKLVSEQEVQGVFIFNNNGIIEALYSQVDYVTCKSIFNEVLKDLKSNDININ